MSLHFKSNGSLDMRYSSSKAAVSSGYSGSSSGYGGSSSGSGVSSSSSSSAGYGGSSSAGYGGSSSYGSQSAYGSSSYSSPASGSASASSNLHYKTDGSLDMRHSSSKIVVAQQASSSPSYGSSYSSPVANPCTSNDLHYKKDGTLDMRYSSSKTAVDQGSSTAGSVPSSDDLHFKKDGTLDMRYASSKQVAGITSGVKVLQVGSPGSEINLNKDGSLDMCFKSSKQIASIGKEPYNIPASVPKKSDGTPDMRTKEAKDFVRQQAKDFANEVIVPNWVPKKKDGTIDGSKAIGREFKQAKSSVSDRDQPTVPRSREDYWKERIMDEVFQNMLRVERQEPQPLPPPAPLRPDSSIPENVLKLDYASLVFESESTGTLGKGAFGIVRKATWNEINVAVKELHLTQLTKKEKADFKKEIRILAALGEHPNLVFLHGYCTDPPCIVMELVERGSLSHLLHYCDDPDVEAKMTDGRVKKRLLCGTAEGMRQLHAAKIVHGDLKPQNVLVTNDYTAKVTDFGLSTLRGKTSSSIRTHENDADDDDEPRGGAVGGTSGYMAPELLDSISPPDFPIDVYSFGILLNEVVSEEEPYSDQYANFAARGPFAAANYAKMGKRPTVIKTLTSSAVENLITQCWSQDPARRPTFENVLTKIRDAMFIIPDMLNPQVDSSINQSINQSVCLLS